MKCLVCEKAVNRSNRQCCSRTCREQYKYLQYIEQWKAGKESPSSKFGQLSRYIHRYIWEKYKGVCARCGWNTPHPSSGIPPLEVEHIDGDWRNNQEANLILICPNCHALTFTFRARNKGKGRENVKGQRKVW